MPVLDLKIRRSGYDAVQQPRSTPANFGGDGFKALGEWGAELTKINLHQQIEQDKTEIATHAAVMDVKFEQLREEIREEPDFGKRDKLYQTKATEYLQSTLSNVTSPRVKAGINQYYSVKFPDEARKTAKGTQLELGEHRVASVDKLGEILGQQIIGASDPQKAAEYRELYHGQVNALSQGPAPARNVVQTTNMIQAWEKKVNLGRANVQIGKNPTAFLVDQAAGKYPEFDEDTARGLSEKARKQLEDQEKAAERTNKKIKDKVDDEWSANANFGKLDPGALDQALKGEHPYISPDRARTLKSINDSPPTGEGSGAVQAIMSDYYLSPRSLPHINATRAKLRALQAQIGKPNPLISKAANELQSDTTTLENQGISRDANAIAAQNRGIANTITEYEANKVEVPPFVERLMGNRTAQDKAKIKATYQREGAEAAKKLADNLAKGAKTKADSVPQKMKDVMSYGN